MCYFLIIHKRVLLCPCSIFRMFSADRKRVETALENCNLPSGRVRPPNTEALSFLSFCLLSFTLSSVCPFLWPLSLVLVSEHFHLLHPSIHASIHHAVQLILYSPETASDCCFAYLFGVLFSGCLHDFLLRTDLASVAMKQIDPVGAIEMTKAILSLPFFFFFLDITKGKLPHHALRCKHSPSTANKLWMRAVAKDMHAVLCRTEHTLMHIH